MIPLVIPALSELALIKVVLISTLPILRTKNWDNICLDRLEMLDPTCDPNLEWTGIYGTGLDLNLAFSFSLESPACQIEEYHSMSNYVDHIGAMIGPYEGNVLAISKINLLLHDCNGSNIHQRVMHTKQILFDVYLLRTY